MIVGKGCEPLPALAVPGRCRLLPLLRLAACCQKAAAGAVLRSGGGDSRADADVLLRGQGAAMQAEAAGLASGVALPQKQSSKARQKRWRRLKSVR